MKFPKNKTTVYSVSRYARVTFQEPDVIVGTFQSVEDAQNYADACEQEMKDKGFTFYTFNVMANTFYET